MLQRNAPDSFEVKRPFMLKGIVFEPVDGYHVVNTCSILAKSDLACQSLSKEDYDNIFSRRPATLIFDDDDIIHVGLDIILM